MKNLIIIGKLAYLAILMAVVLSPIVILNIWAFSNGFWWQVLIADVLVAPGIYSVSKFPITAIKKIVYEE